MATLDGVRWPDHFAPANAPIHVRNELEIAAPVEHVWACLIRAKLWPAWYSNAQDVRFLEGKEPDLAAGTRFRWRTFGVTIESEVVEFVPRERLAFYLGGPLANLVATLPLFAALNGTTRGLSFQQLVVAPFFQVAAACWHLLGVIPRLFVNPESISGVVGIVVEGGRLARTGMALDIAISLSISLAVLNLLPIPVLDGGQITTACLEKAFPRFERLRIPLTVLGLVVLASLMIYTNVHDVVRLWG